MTPNDTKHVIRMVMPNHQNSAPLEPKIVAPVKAPVAAVKPSHSRVST